MGPCEVTLISKMKFTTSTGRGSAPSLGSFFDDILFSRGQAEMASRSSNKAGRRLAFLGFMLAASAPRLALAQQTPDFGQLVNFIRWGGVALSVFVIISSAVVLRIVSEVATRLGDRFTSQRLLIQKLESFAQFAIYLGSAGVCLSLSVRLDPTAIAVLGGALAFSIGFAMRDLVAAFIAGITIMFDRPFQVGDRVEYAGQYGDIVKIGLRSVRMFTSSRSRTIRS
jgi:small-conductance mechanosensitive channel